MFNVNQLIVNVSCVSELCHAATKIQASFRGHMLRKQIEKGENAENDATSKKPNNVRPIYKYTAT